MEPQKIFTKKNENACSSRMKIVKSNFFKLFDDGYIDSITVRPVHGPLKGQDITIPEQNIYSVLGYKNGGSNTACIKKHK